MPEAVRHGVSGTGPRDGRPPVAGSDWPRLGRLAGLAALTLYGLLLTLASLELVPLPPSWSPLRALAGDAAAVTRRAGIVPGLPLFHDRDQTPFGVLGNCVELTAVERDGTQRARSATSTCTDQPTAALLRGPLDKALVRLHFDALVFRDVPPSGRPASGDRILAAIGHHGCRRQGSPPHEVHIAWSQALEDRRSGERGQVMRGAARWSCGGRRLIARRWWPSLAGAPTAPSTRPPAAEER